MASLNMKGPFHLSEGEIDKQVTEKGPGNFALAYKDGDGYLRVCYIGRSDSDVNSQLKHWVGKTRRPYFKYSYASSPQAAFEKECNSYHDFSPSDNNSHPARPASTNWKCPRCAVLG
ncbi:MAG: hypothetical protein ACM3UZ_05070 [Acidobacteriota bacterium]